MSEFSTLYDRLNLVLKAGEQGIPCTFVRLFRQGEKLPPGLERFAPKRETVMSCQAVRHAYGGEPILLTSQNIGCVAAAISLGLVDANQEEPLPGRRTYTCIMRDQSGHADDFVPPSPAQFTRGEVYACKAADKPEFALFGTEDSGRFKDLETARRAIENMIAIQPPVMRAVFFYSAADAAIDVRPDVVVMSVRPVELCRMIQGFAYETGQGFNAVINPLRSVNSDLIARPYLSGHGNVSSFCLGSRLMAGYEADRMGLGLPLEQFATMVRGLEASRTGYPYENYPGALAGPRSSTPGAVIKT